MSGVAPPPQAVGAKVKLATEELHRLQQQYSEGRVSDAQLHKLGARQSTINEIEHPNPSFLEEAAGAVEGALGGGLYGVPEEGGKQIAPAPSGTVKDVAEAGAGVAGEVVQGAVELIRPVALKIGVTAVLVIGSIALAVFGLATLLRGGRRPGLGDIKKAAVAAAAA